MLNLAGGNSRPARFEPLLDPVVAKFGATVTLIDDNSTESVMYCIVGEYEADISNRLLSITSPIAKALIGKSEGDLINVKTPSGDYLVAGRKVTGFSNAEEEQAGLVADLPFLVEDALKKHGAIYEEAAPWQEFVVYDRGVLTGQNPASGEKLAEELVSLIEGN